MSWDKITEMNLDDKLKGALLSLSEEDSKEIESIVTNKDKLLEFKEYIHEGYDIKNIGEKMGLTLRQTEAIKYMLGKL